ncbi:MAG TPA: hypothetical protein VGJ21_04750 [Terracidiphilus sp.]
MGVTLTGFGVTLAGLLAVALSFSGIDFFERFYENIFLPPLAGLLILVAGVVGLATQLGRKDRACVAGLAFLPPFLVVVTAVATNPNVHGVFPLFLFASIPFLFAGIIIGIMALAARRP